MAPGGMSLQVNYGNGCVSLGRERKFHWQAGEQALPEHQAVLELYFDTHWKAFSDSEISFQVAHVWVRRAETGFLQWEFSWADIGREVGFDRLPGPYPEQLRSLRGQSFTLLQVLAERKFGPCYVRCRTPVDNVRITSFFAGEAEVQVIDPRRVDVLSPRLGPSTFACEIGGQTR
jgi:hypothetical protein